MQSQVVRCRKAEGRAQGQGREQGKMPCYDGRQQCRRRAIQLQYSLISRRAHLLARGGDAGDDHGQLAVHRALDLLLRAEQGTGVIADGGMQLGGVGRGPEAEIRRKVEARLHITQKLNRS